jgi:hypothetical protein
MRSSCGLPRTPGAAAPPRCGFAWLRLARLNSRGGDQGAKAAVGSSRSDV